MNSMNSVTEKIVEIHRLAASIAAEAASRLVDSTNEKARSLSYDDIARRLDVALRVLQHGEHAVHHVPAAAAAFTPIELAKAIVSSYRFNTYTKVSTLIIPAGATDVDALTALNQYFRKKYPHLRRPAIDDNTGNLEWYGRLPQQFPEICPERDYSRERCISLTAVVRSTKHKSRVEQRAALEAESLVFADPRDQALIGAAHACKHKGQDIFQGYDVRGSIPQMSLMCFDFAGIAYGRCEQKDSYSMAASGSPCLVVGKPKDLFLSGLSLSPRTESAALDESHLSFDTQGTDEQFLEDLLS